MALTARARAAGASPSARGNVESTHARTCGSAAAYVSNSASIAASYSGPSAGSR